MAKRKLGDIESLIETGFRDTQFCTKTLCAALGMSMSTFHEHVSTTYGVTPHTLLETRRLIEALTLMRDERWCLGAIVSGSGFSSVRTFRRACKRRLGMSPHDVANRMRNHASSKSFKSKCFRKLLDSGPMKFDGDGVEHRPRNVRKSVQSFDCNRVRK